MKDIAIGKVTAKLSDDSMLVDVISGKYAGSETIIDQETKIIGPKLNVGHRIKIELGFDAEKMLVIKSASRIN